MQNTFCLLALALLSSGCVYALRPASPQTEVHLFFSSPHPENSWVRVAAVPTRTYPILQDGHVNFAVPPVRNGCDWYLFGVVKVRDGSADRVRVVEILQGGHVARKLSLAELKKLPMIDEKYHSINLK